MSKPPTTKPKLLDELCYDDAESPYPLEALYDLEGLNNGELDTLWRAIHNRNEPPPSIQRGGARRRIAERLGADEEQAKVMAQQAGPALQQVGRIASRLGVKVGGGVEELSQRVGILERALEQILSHPKFPLVDFPGLFVKAEPVVSKPPGDRSRLMAMTDRELNDGDWGPDHEDGWGPDAMEKAT